ncbi:disease resistance protein RGA2-like [Papaver somniferum]|uniref:disease resistance protein RGA2-like n=1 Tax=Papaver somniferum TaxID=3469 RepID=UPI000E6F5E5D|nr:disease resistance protein RGA2-like [Papaver somniferum]
MAASTILQVLVSPLLGTVFDSLRSLVETEFSLISGANDEFKSLLGILSTIQDVIEDAEMKQLTDKPIRNWLKKLKDVTCDVEDSLDECKTDAALRNSSEILKPSSGYTNIKEFMTGSVPYFFCCQTSSSSRRTIAERVESFIHQFDEISEQRSKFHLNPYMTAVDVQLGKRRQRETTSYTDEPTVYGRENDIAYIVNLLQNDEGGSGHDRQRRDVSICAIVGMGGLGKTTVSQKIYHDKRITDHFAVRCWIYVSEDFSPTRFVKTILKSLGQELAHDQQTLDYLQSLLQEKLGGKRFLVVLDYVWNEDHGKWDTLKTSLSCGGKGSFIAVTTRLKTAPSIMATIRK